MNINSCKLFFFKITTVLIVALSANLVLGEVRMVSYSSGEGPTFSFTPSTNVLPGGVTEFRIEASDPDGLKCARFLRMGAGRDMIDCEAPFSFFVDTRIVGVPFGGSQRQINITVEDLKGNSTTAYYTFDLDTNLEGLPAVDTTKPVVSFLSPKIDTTLYWGRMVGAFSYIPEDGSNIHVEFSATDNSSMIQRVEFYGNTGCGMNSGFIMTKENPPFTFEVEAAKWYASLPLTCSSPPVIYTMVYDKTGNYDGASNYSSSRVLVYNSYGDITGPSIQLLSPTGTSMPANRTLQITAEVSDPAGVRGVYVSVNGVSFSNCYFSAPPYTCTVTVPTTTRTETNVTVSAIDHFMNISHSGINLKEGTTSTSVSSSTTTISGTSSGGTVSSKPGKGVGRTK